VLAYDNIATALRVSHRRRLKEAEDAVRASCRRRAMLRALLGWAQHADWRRFQDAITRLAGESLRSARLRRIIAAWQGLAAASQVSSVHKLQHGIPSIFASSFRMRFSSQLSHGATAACGSQPSLRPGVVHRSITPWHTCNHAGHGPTIALHIELSIVSALMQAQRAAASVMAAHVLAETQRRRLQDWRGVAHRSRLQRAAVLAAQRVRRERCLTACLRGWREWAHSTQQQQAKLEAAATRSRRRRAASVLAAWAAAAGRQAADRSAASQAAIERNRARSAFAALLWWALAAREGAALRSAAMAQLTAGLERCRLRDSFTGWAAHSAAAARERAMLEAHAGRCRRRQLRVSFLAWADIVREDTVARDVLAECQANNAADRRRAAVLTAWREAARQSVYLRTAVTHFRHAARGRRLSVCSLRMFG